MGLLVRWKTKEPSIHSCSIWIGRIKGLIIFRGDRARAWGSGAETPASHDGQRSPAHTCRPHTTHVDDAGEDEPDVGAGEDALLKGLHVLAHRLHARVYSRQAGRQQVRGKG